MKASLLTFLTICLLIASGCTTPVAMDPTTGKEQLAEYTAGYFYGPVDASASETFSVAIRKLDEMGYFRTGELHRKDGSSSTIYARKVGDEKLTVRARQDVYGQTTVRIRIGKLGDLAESQKIYAAIRDAL